MPFKVGTVVINADGRVAYASTYFCVLVGVKIDFRKPGVGKVVFVVDDNRAIRKLRSIAFLSAGFKYCGEASSGNDAIEIAQQIKPDVITVDFFMPGMNGLEAASALRADFPRVPIILFTLYSSRELQKEASKAG